MNQIKELRTAQGLTQTELAEKLSLTKATISKYELGHRQLTPELINALCDIFGCTSDYLLCRSSNPSPEISDEDAAILAAYHASDLHIQAAIKTLLAPKMQESQQAEVS